MKKAPDQKNPAKGTSVQHQFTAKSTATEAPQPLELREGKEPRIDSRLLAVRLGIQHKNTFELLQKHKEALLEIGLLPFKTEAVKKAGERGTKHHGYALLNEDQAYFLLTMSRNTQRVVRLKLELVKAFAQARKRMAINELEYLPAYHDLHDAIARAAGDSPNARWAHINANKAIRVEAGQRKYASPIAQSILTVASAAAAQAIAKADGIKEVQPAINRALAPLKALQIAGAGAVEVQP